MNPELVLQHTRGQLPTSEFFFMLGDTKIGLLQLRHRPGRSKELPDRMANHIYYEIEPEYRGKGYGMQILTLGLKEAKKIGLSEVMLTCNEENLPSKKIITTHGGEYIEDFVISSSGERIMKYRITLS